MEKKFEARLSEQDRKNLEIICQARGVTMSVFIRQLLRDAIDAFYAGVTERPKPEGVPDGSQ